MKNHPDKKGSEDSQDNDLLLQSYFNNILLKPDDPKVRESFEINPRHQIFEWVSLNNPNLSLKITHAIVK